MIEFLLALSLVNPQAYQQQLFINYVHKTAAIQKVDPNKVLELVSCESKFNLEAKGDYRYETGEYMAQGPLQWWQSSFDKYSQKYNLKGKRENPFDQADLAILVLKEKDGKLNWKNCVSYIGWN